VDCRETGEWNVTKRRTDDYISWVGYDPVGGVNYKSATVHGGFEVGWDYGKRYGIELSDDALDAANAKLARIELLLETPPYRDDLDLRWSIREVLDDA
jgi:hypothetical protein